MKMPQRKGEIAANGNGLDANKGMSGIIFLEVTLLLYHYLIIICSTIDYQMLRQFVVTNFSRMNAWKLHLSAVAETSPGVGDYRIDCW